MTASLVQQVACPGTHDFWRCALWYAYTSLPRSPDGSLLLARAESHALHVWEVMDQALTWRRTFRSPTPVLDVEWFAYPAATDDEVPHWCFAVSSRDVPVRLVDARTGAVRRATH